MTIRCGLQLYSVRQSLRRDPWGTLRALSAAGFCALEAANHNARHDPGVGFGVGATEPGWPSTTSDCGSSAAT